MSRRTRRPAARGTGGDSRRAPRPGADQPAPPPPVPASWPNKWFLAGAVLMQAAWIGFLAAMALLS